mmetsp:Transcript_18290/g.52811  ORF Transcript_18290/g.52811 Transcript_18290/m.52811 type:complete len:208 (-) Transcript_18290:167-790(-)
MDPRKEARGLRMSYSAAAASSSSAAIEAASSSPASMPRTPMGSSTSVSFAPIPPPSSIPNNASTPRAINPPGNPAHDPTLPIPPIATFALLPSCHGVRSNFLRRSSSPPAFFVPDDDDSAAPQLTPSQHANPFPNSITNLFALFPEPALYRNEKDDPSPHMAYLSGSDRGSIPEERNSRVRSAVSSCGYPTKYVLPGTVEDGGRGER